MKSAEELLISKFLNAPIFETFVRTAMSWTRGAADFYVDGLHVGSVTRHGMGGADFLTSISARSGVHQGTQFRGLFSTKPDCC